MRIEIVDITPEMAKMYLANNKINRGISDMRVSGYARDMLSGRWQLNGESVKIGKTGRLLDGQHRLKAIIKADIPVKMAVVFDVEDDVTIYDRGRNRSVRDSLLIAGFNNKHVAGHIIGAVKLWNWMLSGKEYMTEQEVADWIRNNIDSIDALSDVYACSHERKGTVNILRSPIYLAMLWAYKSGISLEAIKNFLVSVSSGLYNGPSESAAIIFRNDIMTLPKTAGRKEQVSILSMAERAMYDYSKGVERKISYRQWSDKPTFDIDPRKGN